MNEQIKQIAERLRGLRDVLELTAEDIARDSDISDRKSTRLNSSHVRTSRMPSSA